MVGREHDALLHEPKLSYISVETSDRTGGHAWTERAIEVPQGRLRRLLLEEGKPLTPDRSRREEARLRLIADDPQPFIQRELAHKSDEQQAEQMFDLLPRAFLFRDDGRNQSWEQLDCWPNPAWQPRSYQERILHGMSGTILVDPQALRLHSLQGRLSENVTFGLDRWLQSAAVAAFPLSGVLSCPKNGKPLRSTSAWTVTSCYSKLLTAIRHSHTRISNLCRPI